MLSQYAELACYGELLTLRGCSGYKQLAITSIASQPRPSVDAEKLFTAALSG